MVYCDGDSWNALGGSFGGGGSGGSDNLGNHLATQDLDLAGFDLLDVGSVQLKIVPGGAPTGAPGGAAALPALSSGSVWVGNGSNEAAAVTMTGDGTLSNAGVLTLSAGSVASSEISDGSVATADLADGAVTAEKTSVIGTLTEGKWCTVSSGKIVCTNDEPDGGGVSTQVVRTCSATPSNGGCTTADCPAGYVRSACNAVYSSNFGGKVSGSAPSGSAACSCTWVGSSPGSIVCYTHCIQ